LAATRLGRGALLEKSGAAGAAVLGGFAVGDSSGGGAGEPPARSADTQLRDLVSAEYGRSGRGSDHHRPAMIRSAGQIR
jgi:hypothetical protein